MIHWAVLFRGIAKKIKSYRSSGSDLDPVLVKIRREGKSITEDILADCDCRWKSFCKWGKCNYFFALRLNKSRITCALGHYDSAKLQFLLNTKNHGTMGDSLGSCQVSYITDSTVYILSEPTYKTFIVHIEYTLDVHIFISSSFFLSGINFGMLQ